jgi:hypothetical protein
MSANFCNYLKNLNNNTEEINILVQKGIDKNIEYEKSDIPGSNIVCKFNTSVIVKNGIEIYECDSCLVAQITPHAGKWKWIWGWDLNSILLDKTETMRVKESNHPFTEKELFLVSETIEFLVRGLVFQHTKIEQLFETNLSTNKNTTHVIGLYNMRRKDTQVSEIYSNAISLSGKLPKTENGILSSEDIEKLKSIDGFDVLVKKGTIALVQKIPNECSVCGEKEKKLMSCSRCKKTKYCSVECQKKDWKEHKKCCN